MTESENTITTENKQKQVLKLFKYITLFSSKKRGGKTTFYILGLPIWKIRRMENENLVKYYFLNIPLFRLYSTPQPTTTEIIHNELSRIIEPLQTRFAAQEALLQKFYEHYDRRLVEQETRLRDYREQFKRQETMITDIIFHIQNQKQQLAAHQSTTEAILYNMSQKTEERLKVQHAELLERIDNLPHRS